MDFLGTILWPIRWAIELILVGFHTFWTWIGLNPVDGWTWILAIFGLVIVVRSAMIPLMVKQIKAQRSMMDAAPEIKKIQDKYKGKRDQFSMEAMRRETMEVYSRTGSNPMAGCWPMLVQMPVIFGLYSVINGAQHGTAGVGLLNAELAGQFQQAEVFGAPLRETFMNQFNLLGAGTANMTVLFLAGAMVIVMTASQFITQKQIMSKNISQATRESQFFRQQQMMLYILPLVFAVSGVAFPLGLMVYWTISNFWTMGQQWIVIRQMPTPGSEAAKAREERLRRRGKWVEEPKDGKGVAKSGEASGEPAKPVSTQRQQPMSKSRAKKQGGQKSNAGGTRAASEKPGDAADGDDSSTAGTVGDEGSTSKGGAAK